MITRPPIDEVAQKAGNKYLLCTIVAKRAKELNIMQNQDEIATNVKTISYAAEELDDGKIKVVKD